MLERKHRTKSSIAGVCDLHILGLEVGVNIGLRKVGEGIVLLVLVCIVSVFGCW